MEKAVDSWHENPISYDDSTYMPTYIIFSSIGSRIEVSADDDIGLLNDWDANYWLMRGRNGLGNLNMAYNNQCDI
eukprot:10330734-Ditylum_brightwellii.AAC.1